MTPKNQALQITAGGSAEWGEPIPVAGGSFQTTYEAHVAVRFVIANAEPIYFRLRIIGVDDIDSEGEVPSGWGAMELQDPDGDVLYGRVDWWRRGQDDGGDWFFESGTGKWRDCQGRAEMLFLFGGPEDRFAPMPPTGPIRFYGFLEGSGQLALSTS
jgi:hypothetical protein